jgi:hypothetical protein
MFKISFENTDVEIDMKTGKGEIISFIKTPIISQAMSLHKTLLISGFITLIFCPEFNYDCINGYHHDQVRKFSFKERGWKLALAGILFPLFLFLLAKKN